MATSADVLLHPVRLRIVQALLGDRRLTTADLKRELADVAPATLYRHVAVLAGAGVLRVAEERRVRGAVERTYALRTKAAHIGPAEAAAMSPDDHRRAFTAFVAALLAELDRYLDAAPDVVADRLGYGQAALWLTDVEADALAGDLRAVLAPAQRREPGPGRRRRLLATVLIPDPAPPRA